MNQNLSQNPEPFFTEGCPEIRSTDGGKTVVYGYAALYNTRSRQMTTKKGVKFVEEIMPGAFDSTDFSEVRCLMNHEYRDFLASEPNLRYGMDSRGLWYEYDHDPGDPTHVAALRRIQRRDAKGSSFQFPPLPSDCYTVTREGGVPVRTIKKFPRVLEMGPVYTPAYQGTTTYARSLGIDDLEMDGNGLEDARNADGTTTELGGTTAENAGNPTEMSGTVTELQKKLEERKLQVRATLM